MKLAVDGPRFGKGFRKPDARVEVMLDGRPITHVIAVDTTTGVAWRHRCDASGKLVLNAARDGVEVERISGSFRVVEQGQ